ncbi:hypothetical protein FVR03_16250 [Pontibacter qinzhouensis]|uniref:Uncharacterized protein n=1 Tax=Pontibacter qinzhouensis TaxID=2603253 RepID=A0A5C8JHC5_9BACT|nr:hypothetical protein [Pontibacter qinzhouensis]TXK37028.1 hypothetical protein FVR03_16250 [Pontibacter qinzhouensis]
MKTPLLLTMLFFTLLLPGCKDKDDAAEMVVVKGRVYDDLLQQPVQNMLVYIYDVACKNFACSYNQLLDSTRTDAHGYYQLAHKPKNSNGLNVGCSIPDRMYALPNGQTSQRPISKGSNNVNFIIRKTSVIRARVLVTNNLYPPLSIGDYIGFHLVRVYGANNDTTVYLRGVANQENIISLLSAAPNFSTYYRRRLDYLTYGAYADTFDITIIAEPDKFPITSY